MAQPSDRPPVSDAQPEESNAGPDEWQPPRLTFLGDVEEFTSGANGQLIDGPFNTPGL
jgi:hypothetical protein